MIDRAGGRPSVLTHTCSRPWWLVIRTSLRWPVWRAAECATRLNGCWRDGLVDQHFLMAEVLAPIDFLDEIARLSGEIGERERPF